MAVSSAAATKLCAASFLLGVACGFAMNKYARKALDRMVRKLQGAL